MIGLCACHSSRQVSESSSQDKTLSGAQAIPGPPAMVYKTRADYYNLVPVLLSENKDSILSYPHPGDLKTSQGYLLPVRLKRGYLLDKKGIGKNVAFLNMTYEDYAKLQAPPPMDELEKLIIDRDPLLELYDCGNIHRFSDPVHELNRYIKHRSLRKIGKSIK